MYMFGVKNVVIMFGVSGCRMLGLLNSWKLLMIEKMVVIMRVLWMEGILIEKMVCYVLVLFSDVVLYMLFGIVLSEE